MIDTHLANSYVEWLLETIDENVMIDYPSALFEVASELRCWFYVPNDTNRMSDIIRVREEFARRNDCHYDDFVEQLHPGTMLELLVVLAHECAFMSECTELTARFWFDEMMNNIGIRWADGWMGGSDVNGLDKYTIFTALNRILTRDYDRNGMAYEGIYNNIFIVLDSPEPLNHIELWRQMCLYVGDKCKTYQESIESEHLDRDRLRP